MQYYMPILILVMLLAGLLGGLINHFLTQEDDPTHRSIGKSLTVGIGASFMVPLFLNMISSNLIDSIKGTADISGDPSKILVLAGFCLVAAVSSRAFIRTLSDRILTEAKAARKEAKEAKEDVLEVQASIDPILEKETEKELLPESAKALATPENLDEQERRALEAFAHSKFALRTIGGIAKEMEIDIGECNRILSSLEERDLVGKRMGKNGVRWYITQKGLNTLASI